MKDQKIEVLEKQVTPTFENKTELRERGNRSSKKLFFPHRFG